MRPVGVVNSCLWSNLIDLTLIQFTFPSSLLDQTVLRISENTFYIRASTKEWRCTTAPSVTTGRMFLWNSGTTWKNNTLILRTPTWLTCTQVRGLCCGVRPAPRCSHRAVCMSLLLIVLWWVCDGVCVKSERIHSSPTHSAVNTDKTRANMATWCSQDNK